MSERINDKIKLKTEEAKTLKDLEELIGKSIPQMGTKNSPPFSPFGVTIENEHVIELNLGYPNLHDKAWYSKLAELPDSIGNLTSLTKLFILGNQLTTLPESIGNLESLIYLNLRSNRLRKLPESIGNLKSLTSLAINNIHDTFPDLNQLITLPESIGNLTSLESLEIQQNQLKFLPESIGDIKSLKSINFNDNLLKNLPESIGNLSSLRSFWLNNNRLETLPESIGNLKSLQVLYLNNNLISILPESIEKLTSLEVLLLASNKIEKIPETIGNLKSLRMCEVDDNLLKNIPKSVLELKSLHLSAGSCRIRKQESNIRRDIMNEYKKNVIPAHTNGTYLEKLNEEELRERKIEKKRRREELYIVEKALKDKQVKFVVSVAELEDIKKHARIFHQTQSEFIRTAIRDKIRLIDVQDQDLEKPRENQEDGLILEKLNKIQKALDRIESKEKTD